MPHRLSRLVPIAVVSLTAMLMSDSALAQEDESSIVASKTCYVSKFKFENEGAYSLDWFLVGKHELNGRLSQGQSRSWDLEQANIAEGATVFITYRLDQGNNMIRKSCQKNSTKLAYHPNGNTWGYWAKGSTRINNRCRFRSNKCLSLEDVSN